MYTYLIVIVDAMRGKFTMIIYICKTIYLFLECDGVCEVNVTVKVVMRRLLS